MNDIPIGPEVNAFVEKVLTTFLKDVTDRIFLMIQDDRELMQEYLELVRTQQDPRLNAHIGKAIRKKLNLENDGEDDNPRSALIKESYTRHMLKKR